MESVFVVKAMLDNARIIKQQGLFMIFGIRSNKINPATVPLDWILNKTLPDVNLIIKAKEKKNILRQLENNGISKNTLFPEIEYQGMHLKEMYKDRK